MSFCSKCGAELADGSAFCSMCGAPQPMPQQEYQQAQQQYQKAQQDYQQAQQQYQKAQQEYQQAQRQYQQGQQYQQTTSFESFFNTPDHTAEIHPDDIRQNKAMGVFAYLGLLVLIPIFAAPQSRFARFHANQGLLLDILSILLTIMAVAFSAALPLLGVLFTLLDLPVFALMILGIVNAATGRAKELPIIGKTRILP